MKKVEKDWEDVNLLLFVMGCITIYSAFTHLQVYNTYSTCNPFKYTYILQNIKCNPPADELHVQELSSMFLQVTTAFGLRLQYSWAQFRLYLQAERRWQGDVVGLCGTFNGNIQDDFL